MSWFRLNAITFGVKYYAQEDVDMIVGIRCLCIPVDIDMQGGVDLVFQFVIFGV